MDPVPSPEVKVPEVALTFWVLKILATTLGETGGDALSMSLHLGYLVSTGIFLAVFLAAVSAQVASRRFQPWRYWATILATTAVGTTLADFVDRSLHIGYAGGMGLLLLLLAGSLLAWYRTLGSIAVASVGSTASELFYWVTILFSQTLGTALGDWTADSVGLGYRGSALAFGALLAVLAVLAFRSRLSRTGLFWSAFILTRPLGAVVGDFLDKPRTEGGLALSRVSASLVILLLILGCLAVLPQAPAREAH